MAARTRRTRFAASFVVVIAAGCSHEHPAGTGTGTASGSASGSAAAAPTTIWSVQKGSDGQCWGIPQIDCSKAPPGVTCNPPAGERVPCPSPMPADGFQILTFDGTHCFLADGKTATACPSNDAPPPPPPPPPDAAPQTAIRYWEVSRKHDGTCEAFQDSCSHMKRAPGEPIPPCNPPPSRPIKCPPGIQDNATIEEMSAGVCVVDPGSAHVDCP